MKQTFYILILSIALFGCSKNNPTTNTTSTSKYYFICEVDGKKINVPYVPTIIGGVSMGGVSDKAVFLQGTASNTINGMGSAQQCSTIGSYCLEFVFGINGQTIGIYKPGSFILQTFEGSNLFTYSYTSYGSLDKEDFTINITKIEHSIGVTDINGVLEGSFSNKIKKTQSNVSGNSTVNISGTFALPLP